MRSVKKSSSYERNLETEQEIPKGTEVEMLRAQKARTYNIVHN